MFKILKRLLDFWRPRTEIGRNIKHRILYGSKPPLERQGKRYLRKR